MVDQCRTVVVLYYSDDIHVSYVLKQPFSAITEVELLLYI